jgi:hypothetical protein
MVSGHILPECLAPRRALVAENKANNESSIEKELWQIRWLIVVKLAFDAQRYGTADVVAHLTSRIQRTPP